MKKLISRLTISAAIITSQARSRVIFTPNEDSGLAPLNLHCVLYSKYHSLNLSFVNATVVAFLSFFVTTIVQTMIFRGRAYLTVLDDRSRDPSCGKIPENNLDHNNRKRLRIYRKEEILYVLIAKLGTVPGLSYFQYLGEDIKIRSITCEFPRGMDYDGFLPTWYLPRVL